MCHPDGFLVFRCTVCFMKKKSQGSVCVIQMGLHSFGCTVCNAKMKSLTIKMCHPDGIPFFWMYSVHHWSEILLVKRYGMRHHHDELHYFCGYAGGRATALNWQWLFCRNLLSIAINAGRRWSKSCLKNTKCLRFSCQKMPSCQLFRWVSCFNTCPSHFWCTCVFHCIGALTAFMSFGALGLGFRI